MRKFAPFRRPVQDLAEERSSLLSVYTRHSEGCKHYSDKRWHRCGCCKWIWGSLNGKFIRQSAKTRFWDEADAYRYRLENPTALSVPQTPLILENPIPVQSPAPHTLPMLQKTKMTVEAAVDAYLTDAQSRELEPSTLSKLETIFRKQFLLWTRVQGIDYLDEVDLDALIIFRNTWKDGQLAKQKKQSRLIGFFWAGIRRGYITQNPTVGLGKIKVVQVPTDSFTPEEFEKIIAANYIFGNIRSPDVENHRIRLRTLTLLMRWSGLRIRDAVTLERHRLHGDSLLLYQAKTGTPVYVPLPPHVIEALHTVPSGMKPNPRYFFWSGNGLPKSAVADWQRSYRRLFKLANITKLDGSPKRCHPHMFRDTFAVEMLLAGVPIDQISLLLGHASVKITEKSYAPFVKARQIQLQDSVRSAWQVHQPHTG